MTNVKRTIKRESESKPESKLRFTPEEKWVLNAVDRGAANRYNESKDTLYYFEENGERRNIDLWENSHVKKAIDSLTERGILKRKEDKLGHEIVRADK